MDATVAPAPSSPAADPEIVIEVEGLTKSSMAAPW
jgi:hypothetical protein